MTINVAPPAPSSGDHLDDLEMQQPRGQRHPGDLMRLIIGGLALVVTLVIGILAPERVLGPRAATITSADPGSTAGHVLVGAVQIVIVLVGVALGISLVRKRHLRVLVTTALAGVAAAALFLALRAFLGEAAPSAMERSLRTGGLIASAHFPSGAWVAGAVAVVVVSEPWLSRSWRRATTVGVLAVAVVRVVIGTLLPTEAVLAFAVGAVVASAVLLIAGAPGRSLDPRGVRAALEGGGLDVARVIPSLVVGKGARTFVAEGRNGERWFVKVLGQDERDADILYRAYRFLRLRSVDDLRPAASLRQAVEHQGLVGMVAERAGVRVPRVERVIAADGSALLAMDYVEGTSLADIPAEQITDELMLELWRNVSTLHRARIAHRSLRTGNVVVDAQCAPWIVDFSFSELSATDRQIEIDRAELIASLAARVGPERAVSAATQVLGPTAVSAAVRFVQPLALSAATRQAAAGQDDVLSRVRAAIATATGEPVAELERLQRIRPQTLVMIAVMAGAFYLLLPQVAQVGNAWRAFKSADIDSIAMVVLLSAATYVGAGLGLMGSIPERVRLGPALLVQTAASFVNRVTPASIGGMLLNGRFLEKSGADRATAVAGVGLNSLAGGVVHVVLIIVFFTWSGNELRRAFTLPSISWMLVAVPIVFAIAGGLLWTNWGRRAVVKPVTDGVGSAWVSLKRLAGDPSKLAMLFGGSAVVTLSYILAFYLSVRAFNGDISFAKAGAVYLAATAVAAPSPTPGNLGAIEAALVAALTGVGVPGGIAVSSVLTYRLATYWLPVAPGWLSWQLIQRWQYV